MAQNSKIEWTDHTANLWHGCTKVHEGCDHCYAEALSKRWNRDIWGNDKPRLIINSVWNDLARYQKLAAEAGEVHRVFVGSMMDIFEKPMPLIDSKGTEAMDNDTGDLRKRLFTNISIGVYPNLLFLLLTKRPSNINKYIPDSWKIDPPKNVMFGTSVVNQSTANNLIPQLLQVNGHRFLSMEPLLGPVDLSKFLLAASWTTFGKSIHWIIVGGESGHGARPMHPDWARSIRYQCKAAGVPFFFKQWGEYAPHMDFDYRPKKSVVHNGIGYDMCKVGKKVSGRLLDGHTYDEFPFLNDLATK